MKKVICVIVILFSLHQASALPLSSVKTFGMAVDGGVTLPSAWCDPDSTDKGRYNPGVFALASLQYNIDNYKTISLESGYVSYEYGDEQVHLVPFLFTHYADIDLTQGVFVVRLGMGFGLSNVYYADTSNTYISAKISASCLYELSESAYLIFGAAYFISLDWELNDGSEKENDFDDSISLVPIYLGILQRF